MRQSILRAIPVAAVCMAAAFLGAQSRLALSADDQAVSSQLRGLRPRGPVQCSRGGSLSRPWAANRGPMTWVWIGTHTEYNRLVGSRPIG